jgi:hypothetical protein
MTRLDFREVFPPSTNGLAKLVDSERDFAESYYLKYGSALVKRRVACDFIDIPQRTLIEVKNGILRESQELEFLENFSPKASRVVLAIQLVTQPGFMLLKPYELLPCYNRESTFEFEIPYETDTKMYREIIKSRTDQMLFLSVNIRAHRETLFALKKEISALKEERDKVFNEFYEYRAKRDERNRR